jgi:hypothetical protein
LTKKINDQAFFASIDPSVGALVVRSTVEGEYPWSGVSEDREVVHDALTKMYASHNLPRPKFCWARSPFSMFGAIQYLRRMQTEQRQEVIKGLVRSDDVLEMETKAVFLESVMDRDLTVTMGASLRQTLFPGRGWAPMAIHQLATILRAQFTPSPTGKPLSAGWQDWIVYPIEQPFNYALTSQTLCICPFVKAVWISRPPQFIRTDEDGNLHAVGGPAARFEDGYEVWATHEPELALEAPTEAPKRPKGVSAIDMLREAAKEMDQKKLPPPEEKS